MSAPTRSASPTDSWWPGRRRLALLALATGALTAAAAVFAGGPERHDDFALVYVAIVAVGLVLPPLITVQVVAGQLLLASVLRGAGTAGTALLVVAVGGVVLTAELLAAVARLDLPMERRPRGDLRRAAVAAGVAAAAYALVSLVAAVPGPSGLVAVLLASAACAAIAAVLVRA